MRALEGYYILTQQLYLEGKFLDMSLAIEAKNIVKEFPAGDKNIRVLHGIDLEIKTGEITMIVGPSGCGKTTLISILTGILSATEGEVKSFDFNITNAKDREKIHFRRNNIGFIFQQYNLLPALTAVENVSIPLICAGVSVSEAENSAAKVLNEVDMGEHIDKLPSQLSGGQQQRVSIARALVHDPKLIVCDEPTAALDATSGKKVIEILSKHGTDKERAVVIVTHDNRIFDYADRILHMADGKIEKDEQGEGKNKSQNDEEKQNNSNKEIEDVGGEQW